MVAGAGAAVPDGVELGILTAGCEEERANEFALGLRPTALAV